MIRKVATGRLKAAQQPSAVCQIIGSWVQGTWQWFDDQSVCDLYLLGAVSRSNCKPPSAHLELCCFKGIGCKWGTSHQCVSLCLSDKQKLWWHSAVTFKTQRQPFLVHCYTNLLIKLKNERWKRTFQFPRVQFFNSLITDCLYCVFTYNNI